MKGSSIEASTSVKREVPPRCGRNRRGWQNNKRFGIKKYISDTDSEVLSAFNKPVYDCQKYDNIKINIGLSNLRNENCIK
jgi:hypothetical protein